METKKMSLANIQGKLSRAEMKNIMAGSSSDICLGCRNDHDCAQVNKGTCTKECPGKTYKGCSGL
jgi:hypothetical protein